MKKQIKKFKWILLSSFLALLAGGAVLFNQGQSRVVKHPSSSDPVETRDARTYKAASEGATFEVPENVPKSSIKNYTLVTENEQFKIRKDGNNYLITLYAIINRPEQYDAYKDQLREYKQSALQFLADQGLNIEALQISYEPKEATQL